MGAEWDRAIYGSTKGFIRSRVLWEDMTTQIPGLAEGRLSVLDAGGGSGRLAVRMAEAGNRVTLCDPSQEMLDLARKTAREGKASGRDHVRAVGGPGLGVSPCGGGSISSSATRCWNGWASPRTRRVS